MPASIAAQNRTFIVLLAIAILLSVFVWLPIFGIFFIVAFPIYFVLKALGWLR